MARGKRVELVKLTLDGVEVDAKVCTKCKGNPKPLTEFHVNKTKYHGYESHCKECRRRPGAKRRRAWSPDLYRDHVREVTCTEYEVLGEYVTNETPLQMRHNTCGHEWPLRPGSFLSGGRCPECTESRKKNHDTFVSEVFDLVADEYEVLGEYTASKIPLQMRHNTCGRKWLVVPNNFLSGSRCPECAVSRPPKPHGIFITEVFDLVDDEYTVLGKYLRALTPLQMRHNICGHRWSVKPNSFLRGTRCPECAASKGETRIATYLSARGYEYIRGYKFDDCRHKRALPFDAAVIVADSVIPIEYDGEQHSRPVDFAGRGDDWAEREFRRVQRNDAIKTEYCRANGIPLIRIKHTQFDEIEAFLDRELSALGVTGKRNNTDNNDITRKEDAA
jgi:Zn ribbon nucleic-acid-binding protein